MKVGKKRRSDVAVDRTLWNSSAFFRFSVAFFAKRTPKRSAPMSVKLKPLFLLGGVFHFFEDTNDIRGVLAAGQRQSGRNCKMLNKIVTAVEPDMRDFPPFGFLLSSPHVANETAQSGNRRNTKPVPKWLPCFHRWDHQELDRCPANLNRGRIKSVRETRLSEEYWAASFSMRS